MKANEFANICKDAFKKYNITPVPKFFGIDTFKEPFEPFEEKQCCAVGAAAIGIKFVFGKNLIVNVGRSVEHYYGITISQRRSFQRGFDDGILQEKVNSLNLIQNNTEWYRDNTEWYRAGYVLGTEMQGKSI